MCVCVHVQVHVWEQAWVKKAEVVSVQVASNVRSGRERERQWLS